MISEFVLNDIMSIHRNGNTMSIVTNAITVWSTILVFLDIMAISPFPY